MSGEEIQFELSKLSDHHALKAKLKDIGQLSEEKAKTVQRIYYDSFDWRLYKNQTALESVENGNVSKVRWMPLGKQAKEIELRVQQVPSFVWDLPLGPLRQGLEPIIEMRRLLPQFKIESKSQTLKILNEDQKTVVRLSIEDHVLLNSLNERVSDLGKRILTVPVKGYESYFKKVLNLLEKGLGLQRIEESLFSQSLKALGRTPDDYSAKLVFNFTQQMSANQVTRTIYLRLLEILEANENGMIDDVDSEFLHDYRVSVRRTRSALGQLKGIFRPEKIQKYIDEFSWLGKITGPPRDMDVYLLKYDDYKSRLPKNLQEDLTPLKVLIEHHRTEAYKNLKKILKSSRYKKLIKEWRRFLEVPAGTQVTEAAHQPMRPISDKSIWKIYRRAIKDGNAIKPETPAEALHDLRKTCKKLRYLLEFNESLYPKLQITQLVKVLKSLQQNLGDFQDFQVQRESLEGFSAEISKAQETSQSTLEAIKLLVDELEEQQNQARKEFADNFAPFSLPESQALFKELFKPKTVKDESL